MKKLVKSIKYYLLPAIGLLLLGVQQALAVGFMINAPSHNTGIANAGSAVYDRSVASISNNPAAMSLMSQKQIGGSLAVVIPDWEVNEGWDCSLDNSCADSNVSNLAAIPAFGIVRPMDHDFTWGMGFGAAAGSGMEYGNTWLGRGLLTENSVSVLELMNAISWRMNKKWTFGVGVGVLWGEYHQDQDLPSLNASFGSTNPEDVLTLVGDIQNCASVPAPQKPGCIDQAMQDSGITPADITAGVENVTNIRDYANGQQGTTVEQEGDDIGAKVTLGLTFEPIPGHRLGAAYHYMSDFVFEGSTKINGKFLSDQTAQTPYSTLTWNMPDRFVLSGSHELTSTLELFWDFERVFFDTFEDTTLRLDNYHPTVVDRNFKDANRYAVGGEYAWNDRLILQLGLSFDESPVEDEDRIADIPLEEITKTSFGAIYQVTDDFNVHGYLLLEFLGDGEVHQLASVDGSKVGSRVNFDTDVMVYVLGASFGYKF